jgi:hypothetical protein
MYGDFSKLEEHRRNNGHPAGPDHANGHWNHNIAEILFQQGRVITDDDGNRRAWVSMDWRDRAGRDIIGAGVAAIPAATPNAFRVRAALARTSPDGVTDAKLIIHPGHAWADGLAVELPGDPESPIQRVAAYLDPPGSAAGRDAVILEVYRETLNGFQMPEALIEPALGGVDTTELVHTAMRFRLLSLAEGEDCENLGHRLAGPDHGTLSVSLQEADDPGGDCPVEESGGYTGFEHHLYRVEIAPVDGKFVWSTFNGGLVGRGQFVATSTTEGKVQITANLQAIITSGLTSFYLEAVEWSVEEGRWKVTYGAEATLNNENEIELGTTRFGTAPVVSHPAGTPVPAVFFRLWNDIRDVADFTGAPTVLGDGIELKFDQLPGAVFAPGDYWTFPVRAGDVGNPQLPFVDREPEGVVYHRVPLAIVDWTGSEVSIKDCREIFQPLTKQDVCCSFTVGDGRSSHGDFNRIEEALAHLPPEGGEICLLPGVHKANVQIRRGKHIKITGCGNRTKVHPDPEMAEFPLFHIIDSTNIVLERMDLMSVGEAIVLERTGDSELRDITIAHNQVLAGRTAIQVMRMTA